MINQFGKILFWFPYLFSQAVITFHILGYRMPFFSTKLMNANINFFAPKVSSFQEEANIIFAYFLYSIFPIGIYTAIFLIVRFKKLGKLDFLLSLLYSYKKKIFQALLFFSLCCIVTFPRGSEEILITNDGKLMFFIKFSLFQFGYSFFIAIGILLLLRPFIRSEN